MVQHLLEEVWKDGVHNIEEVLSSRTLALRKLVREVLRNVRIIGELWPQGLHRKLIVVRNLDEGHGFFAE